MAEIIPFQAVLPTRDKAHLIASRSYISYEKEQLQEKLLTNPYSFLHIINPDFFAEVTSADLAEKNEKVKGKYLEFLENGYLEKQNAPNFYLYRQQKEGRTYTGIIAGASVKDYKNKTIKIHEHTLTERENMFKDYLKHTRFNAEPVLITHPENTALTTIKEKYFATRPEFDFTTANRVRHQFWIIGDQTDIDRVEKAFQGFQQLYIADGHHRSASSTLLAEEQGDLHNKKCPANYFMSMFIPESELYIMDYNRMVTKLNDLSPGKFLQQIGKNFEVRERGKTTYKPAKKHELALYLEGNWYSLLPKDGTFDPSDPVESLDSQILNKLILEPVLGITDIKTDHRVRFSGGNLGLEALKKAVDSGKAKAAFALYPITIDDLKKVADADLIMPPKSTWVEPKLRSGLTIYEF